MRFYCSTMTSPFWLLSPSDYEVLKYGTPEFEYDNSIDNLQLLLRRELSGQEVPVVWQHGGSDLLLRTPELSVKQRITTCLFSFLSNAIKRSPNHDLPILSR